MRKALNTIISDVNYVNQLISGMKGYDEVITEGYNEAMKYEESPSNRKTVEVTKQDGHDIIYICNHPQSIWKQFKVYAEVCISSGVALKIDCKKQTFEV